MSLLANFHWSLASVTSALLLLTHEGKIQSLSCWWVWDSESSAAFTLTPAHCDSAIMIQCHRWSLKPKSVLSETLRCKKSSFKTGLGFFFFVLFFVDSGGSRAATGVEFSSRRLLTCHFKTWLPRYFNHLNVTDSKCRTRTLSPSRSNALWEEERATGNIKRAGFKNCDWCFKVDLE